MQIELYFHYQCGFSQWVLNTINNLRVGDKIVKKDIRENPDYEGELVDLCGDKQVPSLKMGEEMICGSEEINRWLVNQFLD